jgi:hypothetical protein
MSFTHTQLQNLLTLATQGVPAGKIAPKFGISRPTCSRIISKHLPNLPKPKGGRPPKISPTTKRTFVCDIISGKAENAAQLTRAYNSHSSTPISTQTVKNALKKADLKAFTKIKCPKLTPAQRAARMKWARKYQYWTVDDWKKVIWSDEVKINLINSDGLVWTWDKRDADRYKEKLVKGTVKHGGGKINIWGCMGWNGVGIAVEVEGMLTKEQYVDILSTALPQSIHKLGLRNTDFYFQQDNDPKHTSGHATNWFTEQDINVLDWPSQSPDLNPIEHLWVLLKIKLSQYKEPPKGTHQLWDRVAAEWDKIRVEECRRLIDSMPRRIQAILKAKGGNTKY